VPLTDIAVVALEQIMAAKSFEGLLFLAVVPFQDPKDRRFQIVVGNPSHHPTEEMEGADVAFEKGFLPLEREGHDKTGMRVVQT